VPFLDDVKKYCTARQATEDNMAHMLCMLHDLQTHTHRICNMVKRTRLDVPLYVTLPVFILYAMTLRHTGHVTIHYMIYHPFDLYFK
jgi:hypothetical protein